jgi:hypothetical protein
MISADRGYNHCIDLTRLLNDIKELWRHSAQKEALWEKTRAEVKALKEKAEISEYPSS